jgi:hypothetical protein
METIRLAIEVLEVDNLQKLQALGRGGERARAAQRIPNEPYRRNGDDRTGNIAKDVEIGPYIDC